MKPFVPLTLACMLSALLAPNAPAKSDSAKRVLIVMDEKPAMEVLAKYLKQKGSVEAEIVDQAGLPDDLAPYGALIGYIHKGLERKTERAIIDYTKKGGRYICLHHSISSGKAKNEFYFDFLGIQLDKPGESRNPTTPGGGYAWIHGVTFSIVNLHPQHYITSHNIKWEEKVKYASSDGPSVEKEYPAFTLKDSEAYMNHKFADGRAKTVLCGLKFQDERNDQLYMQDRAAWIKPQGKGWIFYFQPGHTAEEFKNPIFAQMILNSVTWTPER